MGYEKLLRSLYGSDPQIDLDQQIARIRVPKPMTLDFFVLGDGIRRNNMGVGELRFQAKVTIEGGFVVLQPTGQKFPLLGDPPQETGPAWRSLKVQDWEDSAKTRVEIAR